MREPTEPDHYRALGLSVKATRAQIRSTFNKLAKKNHPDKVTPSKQLSATICFQRLRDAHDVLIDPDRRRAYDAGYAAIKASWDQYDRHMKVIEVKKAKRAKFSQSLLVLRSATEDFSVHEHNFADRSAYIQRELEKQSANENIKRVIDLSDQESDVVCAYVNYLYEGKIDIELSRDVMTLGDDLDDTDSIGLQYLFLAKLYVFGDVIKDDAFCDQVVDTLARRVDSRNSRATYSYPSFPAIKIIYEGTAEGCPGRAMLVDMWAKNASENWFSAGHLQFPPQFSYDLLKKVLEIRPPTRVKAGNVYDSRTEWHKVK